MSTYKKNDSEIGDMYSDICRFQILFKILIANQRGVLRKRLKFLITLRNSDIRFIPINYNGTREKKMAEKDDTFGTALSPPLSRRHSYDR